ncbi:hypothetical protein [Aquimarina macrocephali]|uniref:hypothetical protein n=1 Tax=Aquimarina macrocephali TaxID=666563 RepID=UPI000467B214|nr:hypothetical protein [Aquimarina macrocephali]
MKIDLNNKKFKTQSNTNNGEVSDETIFRYSQNENIIWANYDGGQIIKGNLIGKLVNDHLEFVYQHINKEYELMTGKCKSYPEYIEDGKIKLNEFWQWTCKDCSSGKSTIIEI